MPGQQAPGGQQPGAPTPPGGQTPGQQQPGAQGQGSQAGTETQPTWDTLPPGGAAGGEDSSGQPPGGGQQTADGQSGSGDPDGWGTGVPGSASDGGWETSNQLPGGSASSTPPMPSERGLPPGDGDGSGVPGGQGGDGELDKALKDFDGGILAERAVIQARSNERAGTSNVPSELPQSGSADGSVDADGDESGAQQETASYEPVGLPSQNMPQRPAPTPGATGNVPKDIPDAHDDDIIARQLREAAMAETDPELREKLWEEYRRYKGA